MRNRNARRWLAGPGVVGAMLAATALPASAENEPFELVVPDLLVATESSELGYIFAYVYSPETEIKKLKLDIDLSAVADLATVDVASGDWTCTRPDQRIVCEAESTNEFGISPFSYYVNAKSDAKPGDTGALTIKATADGKELVRKATITVAEGFDVQTDERIELPGNPGEEVGVPVSVRNLGPITARGAVLVFQTDWTTPYAGQFENCMNYEGFAAVCTFKTDLKPGKTYRLSESIPVSLAADLRTGRVVQNYADWWAVDDWALVEEGFNGGFPPGTPGTAGPLELIEQPSMAIRSAPQTDIDPYNNFAMVDITVAGDNPADVAAAGATAKGKVGDEVTVTPAVKNLGPALLESWWREKPLARISIPTGTTAIEVSGDCAPFTTPEMWNPWEHLGEPGAKEYGCLTGGDVQPGDSYNYEFKLRIDEVVTDATGSVTVKLAGDPNAANDAATIVINPTGGTGDDDDSGTGGGDGDGDGGQLPVTGTSTGILAGVGALLLAAGMVGFVLARRRQTRFVA